MITVSDWVEGKHARMAHQIPDKFDDDHIQSRPRAIGRANTYAHPEGHGGILHGLIGGGALDHHDNAHRPLETNDEGIISLKISLALLLLTAVLQTMVVLRSGSVALLADTIHNFVDAATSIPLWIAFALARKGATKRFTYGYGRAEDLAGVCIVILIFGSAAVAAYESALKILHPHPMSHISWVAAAGIIGFIGNEIVASIRIRAGRKINSAALVADGQHSRIDGFTSLAVVVGAIGAKLDFPIVDPLIGLVITVSIVAIAWETAGAVWNRLVDAIEPEIIDQLSSVPLEVYGVQGVHDVRARWMGHKIIADLHITVHPFMTVKDSHAIAVRVRNALSANISALGSAVVHIDPGDPLEAQRRMRGEMCKGCTVCVLGCEVESH